MKKYELTNDDYLEIKEMIQLEYDIFFMYKKLAELECMGKKSSDEYNKRSDGLKTLYLMVLPYYKKLKTNIMRLLAFERYIYKKGDPDFIGLFPCLMEDDFQYFRTRIINNLDELLIYAEYEQNYSNDSSTKEIDKEFFRCKEIDYAVKKDLLNTILHLIENKINDEKNIEVKKQLCLFKYKMVYCNPMIELDAFDANFEYNNSLYLSSYLVGDTYKMSHEYVTNTQNDFGNQLLFEIFEQFMFLYLDGKFNNKVVFKNTVCEVMIRSALMFCNEKTYEDFLIFAFKEFNLFDSPNKKFQYLFTDMVTQVENDKKRMLHVSLKKRK